jgi:hypothetical protein
LDRALIQQGDDHRARSRQRVLLAGKLVYGEADLTVDCAIRDLSEGGARIRISGPVALPSRLHLIEVKTGQAFDCEVAWRRMPEIGLRFLSPPHDLTHSDAPELKMLRRVWLEATGRYSRPDTSDRAI